MRRFYLALVIMLVPLVPLMAQQRSAASSSLVRAGLSSPSSVPLAGEDNRTVRQLVAVPETQWVKGGIIGAVILGSAAYALGNSINNHSEDPQSQATVIGGSIVVASLGFLIGSLIGSGFEK